MKTSSQKREGEGGLVMGGIGKINILLRRIFLFLCYPLSAVGWDFVMSFFVAFFLLWGGKVGRLWKCVCSQSGWLFECCWWVVYKAACYILLSLFLTLAHNKRRATTSNDDDVGSHTTQSQKKNKFKQKHIEHEIEWNDEKWINGWGGWRKSCFVISLGGSGAGLDLGRLFCYQKHRRESEKRRESFRVVMSLFRSFHSHLVVARWYCFMWTWKLFGDW